MHRSRYFQQAVVLAAAACATLSAQSFGGAKMYVVEDLKAKPVKVDFDLKDGSLVAVSKGKDPQTVSIAYSEITKVEYERRAQHRQRRIAEAAKLPMASLFLSGKKKSHWLAVFRGEEETVFQLPKKNYRQIIDAVEARTGKEVKVIVERDE